MFFYCRSKEPAFCEYSAHGVGFVELRDGRLDALSVAEKIAAGERRRRREGWQARHNARRQAKIHRGTCLADGRNRAMGAGYIGEGAGTLAGASNRRDAAVPDASNY